MRNALMDGGRDRKGKDVPKAYSTRRRHNNTTITCVMMSHRNYVKAASQGIPLPLFPKTIIIVAVGCFPVIFLRRRTDGGDNRGGGAAIT